MTTNSRELSIVGLLTVLIGAVLPLVDFFITNIALPAIESGLHASPAALELVVAGYGLAYSVLLVLGGRLGDAFGRRRMFVFGLVGFTVASAGCGLASTVETLVVARILQGAAAAMLLPQVLSTIQSSTSGARRAMALGWYGAAAGVSGVVGQLLGGVLVAGFGWRSVFLVNLPIGLAGLLLARRTVPETRSDEPAAVDRAGTVLLGIALTTLMLPLLIGRSLGWPWWIWLSLAAFPVATAAFAVVERRAERAARVPLVPPSLLRIRSFRLGIALSVAPYACFGGFLFAVAVVLQSGLRMGPLAAGLTLAPLALGVFVASMASAKVIGRFGIFALAGGSAIQFAGIAALAATVLFGWPELDPLRLAPSMLLFGLGQGTAIMTLYRVVLSRLPVAQAGAGSGVLTTNQQASLALGVATLGTLFLTLTGPLGIRNAFLVLLVAQLLASAAVALLGPRLPDPREPARDRVSQESSDSSVGESGRRTTMGV